MQKSLLGQRDAIIRRGVERRLEFIEYRLYWEGGVNRGDIIDEFGVSVPQASIDLATYRERAPGNIEYDASQKRYLPTDKFKPAFYRPNAGRFLVELKAYADQVLTPTDSWIGSAPALDVMPLPTRHADARVLRSLLEAIRSGKSIHIHYHSMSEDRPDPIWRWVTPHAFGFDGLRWHVRAYCHIRSCFRDFVLSRFLGVGEFGKSGALGSTDKDWVSYFDVVLVPNPDLVESKRRGVEFDFEMQGGKLILHVRQAQLYYLDKRLRLDVQKSLDKTYEAPVVVSNRDEFATAMKEATGAVLGSRQASR